MRDDDHDYIERLINRAVGLMVLNLQSDDFLRFLDDLKQNPTPESIATLSRWNEDLETYLAKRVELSRQQAQSLRSSAEGETSKPPAEPAEPPQPQKFLN